MNNIYSFIYLIDPERSLSEVKNNSMRINSRQLILLRSLPCWLFVLCCNDSLNHSGNLKVEIKKERMKGKIKQNTR